MVRARAAMASELKKADTSSICDGTYWSLAPRPAGGLSVTVQLPAAPRAEG